MIQSLLSSKFACTFLIITAFIFGCNETEGGAADQMSVPAKSPESKNVVFRSGFESGVTIESPVARWNEWRQFLSGADNGYNWSNDLPDRRAHSRFRYLVPSDQNLSDYVETQIQKVIGPAGVPTNALYMEVKAYDKKKFGRGWLTRNQYNLYWDGNIKQAYVRYFLFLQPDLETLMPQGEATWRNLMEWRESGIGGSDYRWSLLIIRNPRVHPRLFWRVEAQELVPQRKFAWGIKNTSVPVPIGEWFLLEVFWKQSQGDDGRVWVAVNGTTVADYRGPTQKDSDLSTFNIFKVYTGTNSLDKGPAYQWIDDVEIHTDIPVNRRGGASSFK